MCYTTELLCKVSTVEDEGLQAFLRTRYPPFSTLQCNDDLSSTQRGRVWSTGDLLPLFFTTFPNSPNTGAPLHPPTGFGVIKKSSTFVLEGDKYQRHKEYSHLRVLKFEKF